MGMGSFAVNSYVIEYDELKKICPEENILDVREYVIRSTRSPNDE